MIEKTAEEQDMRITLGIICYRLQQMYQIQTNISMKQGQFVKGFRIWKGEKPEDGILYLCNSQPSQYPIWQQKMHIGMQYDKTVTETRSLYISVLDSIDFYELVNALQEIFQEFYEWKTYMEQLFYQQADFTTILNTVEQTYGLISILVDKNLKYIALSDQFSLYNDWIGESGIMSIEMVNELMTDSHFRNAIRHDQAAVYRNSNFKSTSYYYNIKIAGQYEARILISNQAGTDFYGGLDFVDYIGKKLAKIFVCHHEEKEQELVLYEFYNLIRDLLNGLPKTTEEIKQYLGIRKWERTHQYQVYLFQFFKKENATVTKRYYQTEIEHIFQNACVLPEKDFLCCVENQSLAFSKNWDTHQKISVFLRENLCKVGISQPFYDFSLLHQFYLEAENALLLGTRSESTSWYYEFEQMILPYIWHQAVLELDVHQLYHPAIRTLIQYDKKEHSEMVRTVYEYMKHRYNVTQTAQTLFIHRTSMLFRLQRIEILTGIDWESWEERIHLALTFELMKKAGEFPEYF